MLHILLLQKHFRTVVLEPFGFGDPIRKPSPLLYLINMTIIYYKNESIEI